MAGSDFHLAMSPERIDPGRTDFTVRTMPKIVGGLTPACTERAVALYSKAVDTLVPVSAPETAELAKLLENIFRSVNIALMNEMAMLCDRMGIDVWEVADAAATKPFGFMRFTPGPGLGGHCIPLDPFYLSWRARQFDFHTEFIELAGKVNQNMPYFCREKVARALNGQSKPLRGSHVLVVGVAYKPDIDDTRESPALKLIELLRDEGCEVSYHDPYVPQLREFGLESVALDPAIDGSDCVVVVTNHSSIDYDDVVARAKLVVDFRNATGPAGTSERQGRQAVSVRIGVVGLGYWGPNVVRNMSRVADLAWCCDLSAENRDRYAPQYPQARFTADFDDLLNDPALDAIAVASSVPTHHPLGLRALAAGKHVFIEKPLAASVADARELVEAAEKADRRLMVGHLLLFHPALAAVRALIDSGELGDIYYLYGNRVNLGQVRADENALWSLGAHDVAVLLDLVGERPIEAQARGECYVRPERRGRRLRLPQVPVRRRRAPPPELARPAQDAQADGRRVAEDGRVRRHGDRPQGHDLRQERLAPREHRLLRRVRERALRRHLDPAHRERRAAAARVPGVRRRHQRGARAALQRPRGPRGGRGARGDAGVARRRRPRRAAGGMSLRPIRAGRTCTSATT